ncbi:hypothetical protein B9479_001108 [Cryptococcus floricola]|uniref:Bacterial surface antigen (D15) domain-containing protein n=1 Tax=Cryptococcus floricola TaxID=2591691 RepID=A0A5D3B5N3_9TREE|nr:hypothetical protein B9479_001108 [Cryptococcus floricola]
MDPNAEDKPKSVQVVELDVEPAHDIPQEPVRRADFGRTENPIVPPPIQAPLASSIFRQALEPNTPPPTGPALAAEPITEDPEKIKQWQEEEFHRRLRGEYEQAQRRVGDVVTDNMERPLRLTSIRLSPPPPTTRASFTSSLLSPFISRPNPNLPSWLNPAPPPPTTLHEILLSTRALVGHVGQFGVYDMDRVNVKLEPRRGGDPDEVEMVLALREKGRLFLKAGTEVGGGEGGGNVTARIRNVFGGAESLEGTASLGTKTKHAYQLSLSSPLFASPLLNFALSAFSLDRDNSAFASHRERSQGGRANLSMIAPWGTHDLQYELISREVDRLSHDASVSVRELAQPSTKSSISHTYTSDTRDDPWMGTAGRLLKVTHEYAGLPGSDRFAHFLKTVTQTQLSRELFAGSGVHFSLASLTTFLYPLFPHSPTSQSTTYLSDRTFLGGPNSIRGWKVGGMGRRDGPDSLGGDMSWGMGLSLLGPIPGKPNWPVKWHGFINGGKVSAYDTSRSFVDNITKMYSSPSLSVGLGLVYRLDPLRVEVNFAVPLIGRKGEAFSRGLGVGVGIDFL